MWEQLGSTFRAGELPPTGSVDLQLLSRVLDLCFPVQVPAETHVLVLWVRAPAIEDGGKAAHCETLKVGDELININGSALYGSRQEALILIKGSYRILKLTVRR
ncbi:unnamed protein product [Pleuronectes platessa]|uniref:PDZ domain-containing protein n=1 Tax=Pleuronectes platessa TaxID=8262 RepID=A0A9N7YIM9_PLEPL|nr:unnamed protein product [Pleuronectes platessa]